MGLSASIDQKKILLAPITVNIFSILYIYMFIDDKPINSVFQPITRFFDKLKLINSVYRSKNPVYR